MKKPALVPKNCSNSKRKTINSNIQVLFLSDSYNLSACVSHHPCTSADANHNLKNIKETYLLPGENMEIYKIMTNPSDYMKKKCITSVFIPASEIFSIM